MRTEKSRLPKGYTFPLKPSFLEAALANAHVEIDTHLIRSSEDLFDASFWPPNHDVPHERLYVRAGFVPSRDGPDARRWVESVMIPKLIDWISGILAQHENSPIRREKQGVAFSWYAARSLTGNDQR